MYVDQLDHISAAEPTSPWQTADNYNPGHPFATIDKIAVAITTDPGSLNLGDRATANSQ